jgi:2-polyprenyl-6-hydroxyphenyl methylase/3-demethylubiquinone-9 3-methyltransferase
MPLGSAVRGALGRWEPAAIRLYRGAFIDLDALAAAVARVAPEAKRVVEIGCGDGAMAAALRRVLPKADLVGLDPAATTPGRMYEGDRTGVEFRPISTTELLAEHPEPFDLVILCDVVHHVAEDQREQVLRDAATLTAPGGTVVLKEWERRPGLGYVVAYTADRYVSGDATVRFMARDELDAMIDRAMPGWTVTSEERIPPRRANLLLTLQRPASPA